jgi:hypothetical protein
MHRFWLAAALLVLPLAGAQAQVIPAHCGGILEISGWQRISDNGQWAHSVDLRNISRRAVQVTVRWGGGAGAMNGQAFRMEPGGWVRQLFARTPHPFPDDMLRAGTQIVCRPAN